MGSGPPIPIYGRGICTTNIRCKRQDLNFGQQSLTRGSSRVTLLCLGLPLSLAHENPPLLMKGLRRHASHRRGGSSVLRAKGFIPSDHWLDGVGVEAVARSGGMGPYYEKCLAIAVFIYDMRAARVPNYPSRPLASGYGQMRKSARVRVHMTQPQKRF